MTNPRTLRTPSRPARALAATALVTGLGITLAGCGTAAAGSDPVATETVSVTATPSSSTSPEQTPSAGGSSGSPTPGASASASSASASGSASGPPTCSVRSLRVFETPPAGNGGGTAGSIYTLLSFENTGSAACVLDGHPGVSFVGRGSGTQLGRGASFVGPTKRVVLEPGDQARSQLRIAGPGAYGASCAATAADGFRVYPPDSRQSVFVRERDFRACSRKLPGGRSQLSVTAVGTVP